MKAFRLSTGHQTERKFSEESVGGMLQTGKIPPYYREVPALVIEEMWRRYFEAIDLSLFAGKLGVARLSIVPTLFGM